MDFHELTCACPGLFFVFPSLLRCPGSVCEPLPAGADSVVPWLLLGEEMALYVLGTAPGDESRQDNLMREMWHCVVWVHLSVLETDVEETALWERAILAWWALWHPNYGKSFFKCHQVLFQSVQNVCGFCIVLDLKRNTHSCICCITCSFPVKSCYLARSDGQGNPYLFDH